MIPVFSCTNVPYHVEIHSMKIITWNCNMAFRNKYKKILKLQPDLLVLQECEGEEKIRKALQDFPVHNIIWYGENPHKGVAVISFGEVELARRKDHNPAFQYIVPFQVKYKTYTFNLFCIWAMPHKTERVKNYVGQIWGAVNYYSKYLDQDSILIGDFNSNAIWDKTKKMGNHSDVIQFLNDRQIYSLYHLLLDVEHGKEAHPTLFLLKQLEKPYHMDYCCASKKLITPQTTISIGTYEEWIKLSDHMPVIIEHLID